MFAIFLVFILLPINCFSATHHEPALIDLLWPAVSFTTLFGFIGIKLRKPLQKIFEKKAGEVEELFNTANSKKKEAKIELDNNKNKLMGVEADRQKIKNATKVAAEEYSAKIIGETKQQLQRLEEETKSIIEYEKKKQIKDVDAEFVQEVIFKARNNISKEKKLKEAASGKLLQQIQ